MQTPPFPGPAHLAVLRHVATTVAETGKALAAPARFTLVMLVAQAPRTVEALATLTGSSVAIVSHHLAALRRAGLLRAERRGRTSVHSVPDAAWPVLRGLIAFAAETSSELRLGAQAVYAPDAFDVVDPAAGDTAGPLVLDVRAPDEYGNGHHPAAQNVPLATLVGALAGLPRDRDILCYARGRFCPLSDVAVGLLRRHGIRARRWAVGVVELRTSGRWTSPDPPPDRTPETPA
jgi:rhodanese-related sulfurtransferase/DNA-binding transcriptional ArsR family regulator